MKRIAHSVLVAGLAALALGACTTNGMRGDTARTSATDSQATDNQSGVTPEAASSATGAGAMGSSTAGSTASGTGAAGADQASQSGAMAGTPNSTVTNIEVIPRQSGSAAGTVAGAAVGGSTGTTGGSMTSDRVYRITVRMDDGTTQMITQESTPAFSTGDRIRVADGAIVR